MNNKVYLTNGFGGMLPNDARALESEDIENLRGDNYGFAVYDPKTTELVGILQSKGLGSDNVKRLIEDVERTYKGHIFAIREQNESRKLEEALK